MSEIINWTGTPEALLEACAQQWELPMDASMKARFRAYKDILVDWNTRMNLTGITDDMGVYMKHFADSVILARFLEKNTRNLLDVGTGAGFPGIPVKVVRPDIRVTLMDSLDKRVKFLREVCSQLGLHEIEAVHGRAEDMGHKPDYRGKFDMVTARAVASLPVLLEYCLPFVRQGGLFVAMKAHVDEELDASAAALDELGGEIIRVERTTLPFSDIDRTLVFVRKTRGTPRQYPRKAGKPAKEPIL